MSNEINPHTQIRKLPYKILRGIADLLDTPSKRDWKALIAEMHDKYTNVEISKFEREGLRLGGSPTIELLKDLGYQLVEVSELITYLEAIDHQEALLLLKKHEPVTITEDPTSIITQAGSSITLKCQATGFPRPQYQWFHSDICLGKCQNVLNLDKITKAMEGKYYCKVTNPLGSVYSATAYVTVAPMITSTVNEVTPPEKSEARFFYRDQNYNETLNDYAEESATIKPGEYFTLTTCSKANDSNKYQWYKNSYPISGACQKNLIFEQFQPGDEGYYTCKINVNGCEQITHSAQLNLGVSSSPFRNEQFATAKLALVIANQNYMNPRSSNEQLVHPIDDAKLLTATLKTIGFKVTCLIDLTKKEMEQALDGFCTLLDCARGTYSLFYFSGHGFEENGKTYMVPVDASASWTSNLALSAENVLSRIQNCKKTKLDVLLLDVCRVPSPIKDGFQSFTPFIPGAQCVIGYSTCPQSQSFERRQDKNGIYMKHLSRYLCENIQVEELLFKVGAAVRKETELNYKTYQMSPSYNSTTTKVFSLCDNIIIGTGFVDGERDPTVEWFSYHRLPANQVIEFEMDIRVEVRFEYCCSNTCFCIVRVQNPGQTKNCEAFLQEISDDLGSVNFKTENTEYLSKSFVFDSVASSSTSSYQEDKVRLTQLLSVQRFNGPCVITVRVECEYKEKRCILNEKLICTSDEFGIISFFNSQSII